MKGFARRFCLLAVASCSSHTGAQSDAGTDASTVDGAVPSDAAGDVASTALVPTQNGSVVTFTNGDLSFVVDLSVGARVTTFELGSTNLLTGANVDPNNWGSTFWPSPQSAWNAGGWPPPPEIDNQLYAGVINGDSLVTTSSPSSTLGVSVKKTFAVTSDHVSLDYEILAAQAVSWGPWEVTRVPKNGFAFFPSGTSVVSSGLAVTNAAGITWLDGASITSQGKYAADGAEGWLAYAGNGVLFVKRFSDLPDGQAGPGDGEVELYVNPSGYIELEAHGAYTAIPSGGSTTWSVTWRVAKIPASTPVQVGSAELVALARSMGS
jgi:Domain of unknown function (DUF4380)